MKNTLYGFINVSYAAEEADIRIAIAEKTKQLFIKGNPTPDDLAFLDMAESVLLNPENREIYDREIKERLKREEKGFVTGNLDLGVAMVVGPVLVASVVVVMSFVLKHSAELYVIYFAYFLIALFSAICARHDKVSNADEEIPKGIDCKFCACIFLFWPVCYPYYFCYRNGKKYSPLLYFAILIVFLVALYLIHPVHDLLFRRGHFL
ncbi:hypothetical protein [Chromobacterium haemolyticum]|uniref:hypothetical protein n=1 Tax=Chromobacterium haemolyticum TaxID=394935 RepID=UPI00059416A5|nr:hypothetical protein [Chromobacterium haemolyticum]